MTGYWKNFIVRSFVVCTLHEILLGLSSQGDKMGWACGTFWGEVKKLKQSRYRPGVAQSVPGN
jgi:hypothetical protein